MTGGETLVLFIVFALLLAGQFAFVVYLVVRSAKEQREEQAKAWARSIRVQDRTWLHMTQERKLWSEQVTSSHQWLVEAVRNMQPHNRSEDIKRLDDLRLEISTLLGNMYEVFNRLAADTQKTDCSEDEK